MSLQIRSAAARRRATPRYAPIFAALSDETRLALIDRLGAGDQRSIAQLTHGTRLTRQAVTKHLRVLQRARIVRSIPAGRETLFELDPAPIRQIGEYVNLVSRQWDQALLRLKAFVEE